MLRKILVLALLLAVLSSSTIIGIAAAESGGDQIDSTGRISDSDPLSAGPVTAPVDPQFATPEAAKATLQDMPEMNHEMHAKMLAKASAPAPAQAAAAGLDPALYGQWNKLGYNTLSRSVHVTLLHTGKVLLIAGTGNSTDDATLKKFQAHVWDPTTGAMKAVPPPYDMFCSGHVTLPNGDVLVMGGTTTYATQSKTKKWVGASKAYKFDVRTEKWVALPAMGGGRWYPTAVINAHGYVDVFSGLNANGDVNNQTEQYNPYTNTWRKLSKRTLPSYPGMILLGSGRYYYSGAKYGDTLNYPITYDADRDGSVKAIPGITDLEHRRSATALLAGDAANQLVWLAGGGFPAVATTRFTDFKAANPTGVAGPNLPTAKAYVSAVNLPTLTVFETGGGTAINTSVYEASMLDPVTRTISSMAAPTVGRTYHSSAILLPDATVATLGGDPGGAANFQMSIEIYKPSYMFKGTRPTITAGPTEMKYGGTFDITAQASGADLSTAVIARAMSTTHSTDGNQRVLKLKSTVTPTGLQVTIPANQNLAPPGWYMLFVNDSQGRPSVAKWVHVYAQ